MPRVSPQRFWTVPNVLTLSRIALLPLFFWLVSRPDRRYWAWAGILIVYAIVSDILDGVLARKLGQVTEVGKLLDPLSDKITAGSVAVFCVLERGLPVWILAVTVVRDVALVFGGRAWWKKRAAVPTSKMVGKIAALLWGITLLVWVYAWHPAADYLLWPAVLLYLYAGVVYAWRARRTFP